MTSFAELTARLNLNIQNFASNMQSAAKLADKFAKNLSGKINSGITEPAKRAGIAFKDVSRIVQGILISKAFYGSLNAIRSATTEVWNFSKELESANIAYNNLFGDTALATEFINVLKDFAAVTPFTFQNANAAAKRLLAYGIQYENIMYVMQGILAASTMSGDPQTIDSLSRALGQIYTKGRLMNEEMRQLAEAGIPAYEILTEKLGLTNEQLRNLGNNAIPAHVAINALVEGIQERFGGGLEAAQYTMEGIISNLVDNAQMLFQGVFSGIYDRIKVFVQGVGQLFSDLRAAFEEGGIGGVFERLVPPELQGVIRQLVANLGNLWTVIKVIGQAVWNVVGPAFEAFARVLNVILPIITTVLDVFARLVEWITSNAALMRVLTSIILGAAAAWLVYKTQMLVASIASGVIRVMTFLVSGLSKALTFLAAHPVWAVIALGVGLLVALAGGFNAVSNAIGGLFGNLTKLNGYDPNKVLLPSQKERAADLEKFNNRLSDTGNLMDDLADSTGKAAKAGKQLLSFDEVFRLNEPDEQGNSFNNIWNDFELPDFSGIGEALIPELPEIEAEVSDFVDNFAGTILDLFGGKTGLLTTGIGSVLGAAIGGILFGPVGAKIGAIIGALVGWLWDKIAEMLGLSDTQKITVITAAGIGGAIGAIIGGPLGAVIGTAIGALVGWIAGLIIDNWESISSFFSELGSTLAGWISDAFNGVVTVLGRISGAVGAAFNGVVSVIANALNAIGNSIMAVKDFVWDTIVNIATAVGDAFTGLFTVLGDVFNNIYTAVSTAFSGIVKVVGDFVSNIWNGLQQAFGNVATFIGDSLSGAWTAVSDWFGRIASTVGEFLGNIWTGIKDTFGNIVSSIGDSMSGAFTVVKDTFVNIGKAIGDSLSGAFNVVKDWFGKMFNNIKTVLGNIFNAVGSTFKNVFDVVGSWLKKTFDSVAKVFTDMWSFLQKSLATIYNGIRETFMQIWDVVTWVFRSIWDVVSSVFGWIGDGISWIVGLFTGGNNTVSKTPKSSAGLAQSPPAKYAGHATGGIFNREHIARFAEDDRAEAIIPLENDTAMQPFVDAVANGITQSLGPMLANNNSEQLPSVYVGALIGDDRGLRELYKRLRVIQVQEEARKGVR